MKSRKNKSGILSAAAPTVSSSLLAPGAQAADLSLYYGQTTKGAAANSDGIYVGTGLSTSSPGNVTGGIAQTVSQILPTTISVPLGQYVSISINALLTNNSNSDVGTHHYTTKTPTNHTQSTTQHLDGGVAQPGTLGLATLGIRIPTSANDANGSILQPLNRGPSHTTYNNVPAYSSFATLNGTSTNDTTTPGGPEIPQWNGSTSVGDVEMNSGSVGANDQIFGGNSPQQFSFTTGGMQMLQQFSASSAAYSNSTEFFSGLVFQAVGYGAVTLSPYADSTATQYWSVLTPASLTSHTSTQYQNSYFGSNDTIGILPVLVIDVYIPSLSLPQPVVQLSISAPISYGSSSGKLTIIGGNGSYSLSQITGLNDVTNYVEATGWNPASDEEIYGLDVLVNGQQATGAQLATLINAIDGDGIAPASFEIDASATNPGGDFPGNYNLFLSFPAGGPATTDYLGLDLSSSNDPNLVGYSFSAVAAVPEPMSLSLLAAGAFGLFSRRRSLRKNTIDRTLFARPATRHRR